MFAVLPHADPWETVLQHAEATEWLRASWCSQALLLAHQTGVPALLEQERARRPDASMLKIIDEGWAARLWCLLQHQPALVQTRLEGAPALHPLHAAVDSCNSRVALVKLLLAARAGINGRDSDEGTTALHRAACYCSTVTRLLIQNDACVNAKSRNFATPLHYAAQCGNPSVIALLLEARATDLDATRAFNCSSRSHDGANPLFLAVESDRADSVQMLITAGARGVNAKKGNGMSALLLACARGRVDIVSNLLSVNTEDPGQTSAIYQWSSDDDFTSPLMEAADGGHVATVRLLLGARATLDSPSPNGEVPLITSVRAGHIDVVRLLLEAKAQNFNAAYNHPCFTPLYFACSQGSQEIVELLLEARARPFRRPPGKGPLDTAASHGHVELVRRLLAAGARDSHGQASAAAHASGHRSVCTVLGHPLQ